MRKTSLYKFLISLALFLAPGSAAFSQDVKIISAAPSLTEIVYYLGLDKNLIGVSKSCDYPVDAKNKDVIGSLFSINKEKIFELYLKSGRKLKILALISAKPFLDDLSYLDGIELDYFEFKSVDDVNKTILRLAKMHNVSVTPLQLSRPTASGAKKILYIIQTNPIITIGKDSYITDVISHSGNISVTGALKGEYPTVSKEYIASLNPDIIIVDNYGSADKLNELKILQKGAKFAQLNQVQKDTINRPGPRVIEGIKIFKEIAK